MIHKTDTRGDKTVIGLIGPMGSGKTTACSILGSMLKDTKVVNFNDCIKEEVKRLFPDFLNAILLEEGEALHGVDSLFHKKPPVFRAFLQNYGTELRRKENPDHWVNIWNEKVRQAKAKTILCDSVRFANEADAIRELGGVIIRVSRPGQPRQAFHESETAHTLIIADYEVEGEASGIAKLTEGLEKIVADLGIE